MCRKSALILKVSDSATDCISLTRHGFLKLSHWSVFHKNHSNSSMQGHANFARPYFRLHLNKTNLEIVSNPHSKKNPGRWPWLLAPDTEHRPSRKIWIMRQSAEVLSFFTVFLVNVLFTTNNFIRGMMPVGTMCITASSNLNNKYQQMLSKRRLNPCSPA